MHVVLLYYHEHLKLFSFPDEPEPDVNLTVLPSLTIPPLTNISIICDANEPRIFPTTPGPLLQPVKISIYIGTSKVKECSAGGLTPVTRCVYDLPNFFPILPRTLTCNAESFLGFCRFKASNITLMEGW